MPKVSTAIRSMDYNEDTSTLTVEFRSKSRYNYAGVDFDTLFSLMTAPSLGKFFNENIREQYPASRVEREAEEHLASHQ